MHGKLRHFGIVKCRIHFWLMQQEKFSKSVKIYKSYYKKFTAMFSWTVVHICVLALILNYRPYQNKL